MISQTFRRSRKSWRRSGLNCDLYRRRRIRCARQSVRSLGEDDHHELHTDWRLGRPHGTGGHEMTVRTTGDSGDMVVEPPDPMTLLDRAVQQGATPDQLEKLLTLQERWEAEKSRRAYTLALAEFKRRSADNFKEPARGYPTKRSDQGPVDYKHATLGRGRCQDHAGVLAKHGLSHSWKTSQRDGNQIVVRCVLTHKDGHTESRSNWSAPPDMTGGKNSIQAVGSTVTYLERYSSWRSPALPPRIRMTTPAPGPRSTERRSRNCGTCCKRRRPMRPSF